MIIILLLFAVVLARLFYWQVLVNERLAAEAARQQFSSYEVPALRGNILASDGFPLASNRESFLLYADLTKLEGDPEDIVRKVVEIVYPKVSPKFVIVGESKEGIGSVRDENVEGRGIESSEGRDIGGLIKEVKSFTKEEYQDWLKKRLMMDLAWVALVRKVDRETKEQIESLGIAGLGFERINERFYPEMTMGAHFLGFVGSDFFGEENGYFGLEGFYERELSGRSGELVLEKDALGRPIVLGDDEEIEAQNGRDLKLTIDRAVQFMVERYLKEGIEQWEAKGGTAIVMRPGDGGVLAMASYPTYEPGRFDRYEKVFYKNPAVAESFEPGSILKPLIMAMAINEGRVTPESRCEKCQGPRRIGEYTIRTFNDQYRPNSTMTEVLINSDNIGMVYVTEKLGTQELYNYLLKLGFNEATGIDLQDEEVTVLRSKEAWSEIDQATVGFGQGVAVSAMQMVRAFASLANGGFLIRPFMVQSLVDEGHEIVLGREVPRKVFSTKTVKEIASMLGEVAEKSPLRFPKGRTAGLEDYKIAAKSGTAQIPLGGGYSEDRTIGSVIGYAPIENPQFVVYVKLVEPQGRPWGSDTAGPVFFKIVRDLLLYYNIAPGP